MLPGSAASTTGDALRPISDRSEVEILDRVGTVAVAMQRAGAELLVLAYEWAVAHPTDRLDPVESARPGRERAKLYGGPGTPEVTEFAAAQLGARMGRGTHAGRRHIAAALDLRLRLPRLWARVQSLEVRDTYAIHVAEATRNLTQAEAAWVDGEVAEQADGRIPWSRFQTLVAGKVAAAAPHLAREREERAARARFARRLMPLPGDDPAGMATFMIRAPIPVIDALDHAVATLASRLESSLPAAVTENPDQTDTPTTDDLRVQAVALLAGGFATQSSSDAELPDLGDLDLRDLLPATSLVVHLYGGTVHADTTSGDTASGDNASGHPATFPAGRDVGADGKELDRIARVEGYGTVTETWLRTVLGRFSRFAVLPVLDIDGLAPVDAYEIPHRHRRAVQLRHPVETFPWGHAHSTHSHTQIDHETPWSRQPGGGTTTIANLTPLSTHHHRLKTHSSWQVREPFPGIHLWRDPHGHIYLRDATGTRSLPGGRPPQRPTGLVEIYHNPPLVLADDFALTA